MIIYVIAGQFSVYAYGVRMYWSCVLSELNRICHIHGSRKRARFAKSSEIWGFLSPERVAAKLPTFGWFYESAKEMRYRQGETVK